MKKLLIVMAVIICICSITFLTATPASTEEDVLNSRDEIFLKTAARDGIFQVRTAELAIVKSGDEAIKAFGKRLEDAHTEMNKTIESLASDRLPAGKSVSLPGELDAEQHERMRRLEESEGNLFDRTFLDTVAMTHRDMIETYETEKQHGKYPPIRRFASDHIGTLKKHLDEAERLLEKADAAK